MQPVNFDRVLTPKSFRTTKRRRAKRSRRHAVDHQFERNRMIRQREQVFGVEDRREFLGEYRRIFRAKSKRYDRTGVAKDCMPNSWLQLVKMLVCKS